MEARPGKFLYMLIGGLISTFLSYFCLPLIYCCCFNIGVGSYLGFRMWIRSPRWMDEPQASSGDAAVIGMGAGVIAGVLTTLVSLVMTLTGFQEKLTAWFLSLYFDLLIWSGADVHTMDMARQTVTEVLAEQGAGNIPIVLVSGLCITVPLYAIFGAIWALIGASLFHKDQLV